LEPHFGTLEALADAACEGLSPFLGRPYALFGHCAGALQAYELGIRLAERRCPSPSRIFLSSQPPPDGAAEPSGFTAMSETELLAELSRLLTSMGAKPTGEMLDVYMSVFQPDLAAVRRYRQARPIGTPLTVIDWTESGVPAERLAGWMAYGDVTFESLPGGHYDFLGAPPALQDLFQSSTWALAAAARGGRSTSWTPYPHPPTEPVRP
jgi:surfactin synthase thioesterase subunit